MNQSACAVVCGKLFFYAVFLLLCGDYAVGGLSPESIQREGTNHHKTRDSAKLHGNEADESLKENGDRRSNGIEDDARSNGSPDRRPDVVDDHPGKSRYS